jgi:hypothetical protein
MKCPRFIAPERDRLRLFDPFAEPRNYGLEKMKRCTPVAVVVAAVLATAPQQSVAKRAADTLATRFHVVTDATWKYSASLEPSWFAPSFDDSGWQTVVAPSGGLCSAESPHWGAFDESPLPGSDALPIWGQNPEEFQTIYFRKTFRLATNTIGIIRAAADDELDVYVNGVRVASESNFQAGPIVKRAVSLPSGSSVIAMKAFDSVGVCQGAIADLGVVDARCSGARGTIVGSTGADVLTGGPGRDVIVAFGGNDSVNGAGGDDLICGGQGADTITAGAGDDIVFAQRGADTIAGNRGDDRLNGAQDSDALRGARAKTPSSAAPAQT